MKGTLIVVGFVFAAGCVSVATTSTYSESFVRRDSSINIVDDSLRYLAKSSVEGETLAVSIETEETCRSTVTPIYHKFAHRERSVANGSVFRPQYVALYGLAAAALGVYTYADANNLSATSATGEPVSSIQTTGLALVGVAAALLTVAAVDGTRLRSGDEDLGDVKHEPEVAEQPCHERPVKNEKVILRVQDDSVGVDWKGGEITDGDGVARIGLGELPEAAFRRSHLKLDAVVADQKVVVSLSEKTTSTLLEALIADPQSRVAQDRGAAMVASCDRQVGLVEGNTITQDTGTRELERMEKTWSQAKDACGDKWRPAYEVALNQFRSQVESTAQKRAAKMCGDAAQQAMASLANAEEMGLDEDTITVAHEVCKDVADGVKLLAPIDARFRRLVAARDDAARSAAVLAAMDTAFSNHDALALEVFVAKQPQARAALQHSPQAAVQVVSLAKYWIERIPQGGSNSQLCAAHTLVQTISGSAEWVRQRHEAVERAGAVGGSKIANAMEGCK